MSQPAQNILQLLQVKCSVSQYRQVTQPPADSFALFTPFNASEDYWKYIPSYLVSRCPICDLAYFAQIDTYSLRYSPSYSELGQSISPLRHETPHCPHYVATHRFENLNGNLPTEADEGKPWKMTFNTAEVPCMQKHLLPADIESYAVLHALPVCRVEEENFVPRYTLYIVVYYSIDRTEVLGRWSEKVEEIRNEDHEYYESLLRNAPPDSDEWDLTKWVDQGLLKWLDLSQPDLPLKSSPSSDFPYAKLEGRRRGFVYSEGVISEIK